MNKKDKPKNALTHSKAAELLALLNIQCPAGQTLDVDKSVRLHGTISRGEDYKAPATVKALSLSTVGLILRHCGITRESALSGAMLAILESAKEDYKANPADEAFADTFRTKVAAELPWIDCDGKRLGSLLVEDLFPVSGQISVDIAKPESVLA